MQLIKTDIHYSYCFSSSILMYLRDILDEYLLLLCLMKRAVEESRLVTSCLHFLFTLHFAPM